MPWMFLLRRALHPVGAAAVGLHIDAAHPSIPIWYFFHY
jgi:hypothetical protein